MYLGQVRGCVSKGERIEGSFEFGRFPPISSEVIKQLPCPVASHSSPLERNIHAESHNEETMKMLKLKKSHRELDSIKSSMERASRTVINDNINLFSNDTIDRLGTMPESFGNSKHFVSTDWGSQSVKTFIGEGESIVPHDCTKDKE